MTGLPDFREELVRLYPSARYLWMVGSLWMATGAFLSVGALRLIAPKLPMDQHWAEIARRKYPVLVSLSLLWIVMVSASIAVSFVYRTGVLVPGWVLRTAMAGGGFTGYLLGLRVFFRTYGVVTPNLDRTRPSVLQTLLANLLLRWGHIVLAFVFAALFREPNLVMFVSLAGLCVFVIWYAMGGGVAILRMFGWARPIDRARETSLRALASMPSDVPLYELRSRSANAFAFPSKRIIVATTECLAVLEDAALASVLRHEQGHLHETKSVRRVRIVASFAFAVLIAITPLFMRALGAIAGGYAVLGCLFAIVLVSKRLLRDTEKHADDHGKEGDPNTYARALERIYEANGIPAVLRGKGGLHGHLYDRVVALGVQPSYPRPLPPPRGLVGNAVAIGLATSLILASTIVGSRHDAWAFGVSGVSSFQVGQMAYAANTAGDAERAITLYGFQSTLDAAPYPLTNLAIVAGNAKRCELSERAIAAARARVKTFDPVVKSLFRSAVTSVWLCNPSSQIAASIQAELGPPPEDPADFDPTLD